MVIKNLTTLWLEMEFWKNSTNSTQINPKNWPVLRYTGQFNMESSGIGIILHMFYIHFIISD